MRNSIRRSGADRHCVQPYRFALQLRIGVDDAAELDKRPVAGSLDDPASMNGDRGIDEIAAKSAEARQRPLLVGPGQAAEANDVGGENRRQFPRLGHFLDRFLSRPRRPSRERH